jgi:hypothetical protein
MTYRALQADVTETGMNQGDLVKLASNIKDLLNEIQTGYTAVRADLTAIRAFFAALLTGSATYDAASLVDGAGATTTVTVTGAAVGDFVLVSHGVDLSGITVTGYVSATNTVSVRFQNESGGTLDLASSTLRALVFPQATFTVAIAALTSAALTNTTAISLLRS